MRRNILHRWLEALARHLLRLSKAEAESEERLRLALEGADDGIWDWHLDTDKMVFNERWFAMLGLEPGDVAAGRAGLV